VKYDNKTGLPVEPFVLEDLAHDLTDQLLVAQCSLKGKPFPFMTRLMTLS
jgi:hypothetical protein